MKYTTTKNSHKKVDAKDKILGKLAQRISVALRGKYKPHYNPAVDTGDYVVVKNARHVAVSGLKREKKEYQWHSGYPGALTTRKFDDFIEQHPNGPLRKAVWGMLPKNNLRKVCLCGSYFS